MKIFSFLFAVTILILAIKPGMDMLWQQLDQQETCCSGSCQPPMELAAGEENHTDHLPGNCEGQSCCNPFQVCCTCLLHCLEIPAIQVSKPGFISQENFTYHTAASALFTSEFWQPPRMI